MSRSMSDERHSEVLGGLPRTRPHRRSDKRAATSAAAATPGPETTPAATKPAAKESRGQKAGGQKAGSQKAGSQKAGSEKASSQKSGRHKGDGQHAGGQRRAAADTPAATGGTRLRQPAQPDGLPAQPRGTNRPAPRPSAPAAPPKGGEILGTAVQAAAEIAEIGLSAGARAIRRAVSRLPRP